MDSIRPLGPTLPTPSENDYKPGRPRRPEGVDPQPPADNATISSEAQEPKDPPPQQVPNFSCAFGA